MPLAGTAHVNSPDVYYDGYAGPYHLLVTLRPPAVVPGVAQVQIRSVSNDVSEIKILPLRMIGVGAKMAPLPDPAKRSQTIPNSLPAACGSWCAARGKCRWKSQDKKAWHSLMCLFLQSPPVRSRCMPGLGILLAFLGLALAAGLIGIIFAATRDAELKAGERPAPAQMRRGRVGLAVATAIVLAAFILGNKWWGSEASANDRLNYRIPNMQPSLTGGSLLRLHLDNPNEAEPTRFRTEQPDRIRLDDLIPDHGHLMHLFIVRMPDMKAFWHLHPDQTQPGDFAVNLPIMPEGQYKLYADIVHHTGFPETQVATVNLPAVTGEALSGDDAGALDLAPADKVAQLSGGYRMVWQRDELSSKDPSSKDLSFKDHAFKANQPYWFRFRVEDKDGKPATDLEPYMGMAAHAAFISTDGNVFAHVHPAGSVSMAAVDLAEGRSQKSGMENMDHAAPSAEVSFPLWLS